ASPSARPLTPPAALPLPAASITFQLRRGRPTAQEHHGGHNMASRKSSTTAAEATKATTPAEHDQVTIVGRLCTDPVLRHTKSGKPVTTIRVAVNAPDGEATFHSVVVWDRSAEVICEYLLKGR